MLLKNGLTTTLFLLVVLAAACRQDADQTAEAGPTSTPLAANPTAEPQATRPSDFVVIATDAPLPPFTRFNEFGEIEGFDSAVMENIAAAAGLDYEFVVTPYQGVLDLLASGSTNDFDAVMSSLLVPESPQEGIVYSEPYLEVGQVVVVLADENELAGYLDIQPGMSIGVQRGSQGEKTARDVLQISEADLFNEFEQEDQLIQALLDETVRAVIIDSYSAEYFAETYPRQLKIVGGEGAQAWIDHKSYALALAASNEELLQKVNEAIRQLRQEEKLKQLAVTWLTLDQVPVDSIDPGESRVGTPVDEFFIGMVGQLQDLDPASSTPDFINWEIMHNSMSGLYGFTVENELVPVLADASPAISEDKLEYTVRLKPDLTFPDGSDLTAEDVRWSVIRSSRLGNFLVNSTLKDSNDDGFADVDSVQVIDPLTVRLILQAPTAYFPSLLAIPPFFPINSECYAETADPGSSCGGLGPYTISRWDGGDRIFLTANPAWPGAPAPSVETVIVRFYNDPADMRRSLAEFQSIDLAWTGLPYADFVAWQDQDVNADGTADIKAWTGPSTFKSYLIFEQSNPPWDNRRVRQAAAYALDRETLIEEVFAGQREPLFSPVPDAVPGHLATLPDTNLEQARALMLEGGYTAENPLEVILWFVNDGRYSDQEEQYITAIAEQLNASEVFLATVQGAPWDQFRVQMSECGYPAYLLGWPSPGRPADYLDPSSWTDFFVQETDSVICSNFENVEMDELVQAANEEMDPAQRMELYAQIQQLWASEIPTLDISQEPRRALSLSKVGGMAADALGLLRYEHLTKSES